MAGLYHINPELEIPLYQQLVDSIRAAVKSGAIPSGGQLPTVAELAQELDIARGTVKRAYDKLEQLGLVEKIQGRGTFVCYQPPGSGGRKEEAMEIIDSAFDRLERLGLPPEEIRIFLTLKMRERLEDAPAVKVAVVECNPENLSHLASQLRSIEGIELRAYQLSQIEAYPYNLGEEVDLVVTTEEHAPYLRGILPAGKRLARIALRLSPECMARLVKLRAGESVGLLVRSSRFGQLLRRACEAYTEDVTAAEPQVLGPDLDWDALLAGKTALLVPDDLYRYLDGAAAERLEEFSRRGQVIGCAYEMDEGSFLYVQELIARLRQKK